MPLRALPLTDKSRPGGRPRDERANRNAFSDWLSTCGMKAEKVATKLGVSPSAVYNARNGYYKPGLALAVKIAKLTKGKVPVDSWLRFELRERKTRAK
jgi:DNA-binding XRE family transcriptional regulator